MKDNPIKNNFSENSKIYIKDLLNKKIHFSSYTASSVPLNPKNITFKEIRFRGYQRKTNNVKIGFMAAEEIKYNDFIAEVTGNVYLKGENGNAAGDAIFCVSGSDFLIDCSNTKFPRKKCRPNAELKVVVRDVPLFKKRVAELSKESLEIVRFGIFAVKNISVNEEIVVGLCCGSKCSCLNVEFCLDKSRS